MNLTAKTKNSSFDVSSVKFRLDVASSDDSFIPVSFHQTFEKAFDAGLMATTGQAELALTPPRGWDFRIVEGRA